jgi:hypothetical protein
VSTSARLIGRRDLKKTPRAKRGPMRDFELSMQSREQLRRQRIKEELQKYRDRGRIVVQGDRPRLVDFVAREPSRDP